MPCPPFPLFPPWRVPQNDTVSVMNTPIKPPPHPLAVLILAAGESARFGGRKQLADINGSPMICHAIEALRPVVAEADLFVVLGAFQDEIGPVIDTSAHIITNDSWASGMGSSIAAGMAKIQHHGSYDGVLIALCDQVRLGRADYDKLITAFNGQTIVAARHDNGFGVPAIFPAHMFKLLAALNGQAGARKVLNGAHHEVIGVDLPNAAQDIDTQDDLIAMRAQST